MEIFLVTFAAFSLAVLGLAIGWLVKGRELQGSCGGLNKLNGMEECQICGRSNGSCEDDEPAVQSQTADDSAARSAAQIATQPTTLNNASQTN